MNNQFGKLISRVLFISASVAVAGFGLIILRDGKFYFSHWRIMADFGEATNYIGIVLVILGIIMFYYSAKHYDEQVSDNG